MPPRATLALSFAGALAVAAPAEAASRTSHFVLGNGMHVVVVPDHRVPVMTHQIWYKVGAADDPTGQSGIAHFLKHLMFKGTARFPDGYIDRFVTANGGSGNAVTSADYTIYYQRLPKQKLGALMELEADRMVNLQRACLDQSGSVPRTEICRENDVGGCPVLRWAMAHRRLRPA